MNILNLQSIFYNVNL